MKLFGKTIGKTSAAPEASPSPLLLQPIDALTKPASKGAHMTIDISGLKKITGFIGGCLVDSDTGLMMASELVGSFNLEVAAAANTEVVRAKNEAVRLLGLKEQIDDILISLDTQLHLIRPLESNPAMFLYVALEKKGANLGLARVQVKSVEQTIVIDEE